MNTFAACFTTALIAVVATSTPASAQTTGLARGDVTVWAELGFVGDIAGNLNSSGTGIINGGVAEINANSWGERYDAALLTRVGGGYALSETDMAFLTLRWEQAEADPADVGLVRGQPLSATFSDYQGWGIDVGYRHYTPTTSKIKPFGQVAVGFTRIQEISADMSATTLTLTTVPFYGDSWVISWRFGGGVNVPVKDRFGIQANVDIQYTGTLNDEAGLGTLGFERINDAGNKWSLPITVGFNVKF